MERLKDLLAIAGPPLVIAMIAGFVIQSARQASVNRELERMKAVEAARASPVEKKLDFTVRCYDGGKLVYEKRAYGLEQKGGQWLEIKREGGTDYIHKLGCAGERQ